MEGDLETTEGDEDDVADSNPDLATHLPADMAHALLPVEAVGLEPRPSVHLQHLRVLCAPTGFQLSNLQLSILTAGASWGLTTSNDLLPTMTRPPHMTKDAGRWHGNWC